MRTAFLFLAVAAVWWMYYSCQPEPGVRDISQSIEEGRRVTALILATSRQEGLDAAVLISYEPLAGRVAIFNVPTTLSLESTLEDSRTLSSKLPVVLEAAFAKESAAWLFSRIQTLIGQKLDLLAVIPTTEFLKLVDLMGGVYVNVPARISFRSATPSREFDQRSEWIEIPEGDDVFFDSDKTQMYLSYKYDGLGMRGQLFRAQRFSGAFLRRVREHLDQEWFRRQLVSQFTYLSAPNVISLIQKLSELPESSIEVKAIPGHADLNAGVTWISRNALNTALPRELKPLIQAGLPKSRITVQLLNGSGTPNIAARLREQLSQSPDIDIVEMGNARRTNYEVTEIIDRAGHLRSAERIRELLGAGVLRQDVNPKAMIDVTVVIGKDLR